MPSVKFDRIVSCSSEDPTHPAKNLLLSREYNKKWKCKEPGEESVSVIIQLDQPYIVTGIDIGNESSSFVEVLVSRTSTPDDFQVLLAMSSFMTPMDARSESNRNRVRMFSFQNLSEPVRAEKWDRVKLVCSQPFNRHMKYGLSFIVMHTNELKREVLPNPPVKTLGRFALKDDDDDENNISIGSFFSRRKDFADSHALSAPSTAGAVRDASSEVHLTKQKDARKRTGSDELTNSQKKKRGRPKETSDLTEESSQSPSVTKPQKVSSDKTDHKGVKKHCTKENSCGDQTVVGKVSHIDSSRLENGMKTPSVRGQSKQLLSDDSRSTNSIIDQATPQTSQAHLKKQPSNQCNVTYKPFNKLMEDVEIVISGYVNPGRANLREKALQMGAKYKPDWCQSSTHLICAFANTPKFQQVKGKGIIVTRDWVDDCFQERKKLSWRRYAVDRDDQNKHANVSSEPEVWELIPGMDLGDDSGLARVSRHNNLSAQDTRLGPDSSDSEDEIERIKAKQMKKKLKKEIDVVESKKCEDEEGQDCDKKAYNSSTDIDSEEEAHKRLSNWSERQREERSRDRLPPLPDFFKASTFYLSPDLSEKDFYLLARYITAFGGELLKSVDGSPDYIIALKKQKTEEVRPLFVSPEWIWECNDRQKRIPTSVYELN